MTDPVIPPEAVEAAAKAAWDSTQPTYWQDEGGSWEPMESWAEADDTDRIPSLEAMRVGLTAALPHLRPLVEAQELRLATKLGLELGRKEAAEQIAAHADHLVEGMANPEKPHNQGFTHACVLLARYSREIARTDPSGHSDLPPTPDALSNRLSVGGPVECSCYKLAPYVLEYGQHHQACPNGKGDSV